MPETAPPILIKQNTALETTAAIIGALLPQLKNDQVLIGERQFNQQQKQQLIQEIKGWAQNQFPYVFNDDYFRQKEYSEPRFLKELSILVSQMPQPEQLKKEAEKITVPSRPTLAQLHQWQEEMKTKDQWLLNQAGWVEDETTLEQLFRLSLEEQIFILDDAHQKVFSQAVKLAPENLPPEQKIQFAHEISQGLVQRVIIQQLAGKEVDPVFLQTSLQKLARQNSLLEGLKPEQIKSLTENLSFDPLAEAKKKVGQAQLLLTPTYEESRVKLEAAIQSQLGFSEKKAQEFCWRLEANLSRTPTPHTKIEDYPLNTEGELKKTIKASLETSDYANLGKQAKTPEQLAQQILPLAQTHQTHLVLAQQAPDWRGISHQAVNWTTQLSQKGLRDTREKVISTQAVEHLLRGLSADDVAKEVAGLRMAKAHKAKIKKLEDLQQQLEAIDLNTFPKRWRRRIKIAQEKAKFLGLLDKTNPFAFKFWQHWLPDPARWFKTKIEQLQAQYSQLKLKKYNFSQKINPFSFRNRMLRKYKRQVKFLRAWGKIANRLVRLPAISRNPILRKKLRRFLFQLPQKLQKFRPSSLPKFILKPIYNFLKEKTGRLLIRLAATNLGKKLFKGLLGEAGSIIAKEGFKKGGLFLLGALGLSATGVGAVLAVATGIWTGLKYAFKLVMSPAGREVIKKIAQPLVSLVGGILLFLAQHASTLLGAGVGFGFGFALGAPFGISYLSGSLGALIGGRIGYFFDSGGFGALFTPGTGVPGAAALGKAPGLAALAPTAAPATGLSAFLAAPAAAVPITVGGVTVLTAATIITQSAAFISPEELPTGPGVDEYIKDETLSVNKKASPTIVDGPGKTITYTIEVSSQEGGIKNIVIADSFNNTYLTLVPGSINPEPSSSGELKWEQYQDDFAEPGAFLEISYQATTKSNVASNTRIRNEVQVNAVDKAGESITRKDYVIINSACQDVVAKAAEIMADLIMASEQKCEQINPSCVNWILTNRWEGYLHGYNCPVSEEIRSQTNPLSTTDGCVVCNDLVTMSYLLSNHPNPQTTGWAQTAQKWKQEGILAIDEGKGDISQVSEGDIVYFDVMRTDEDGQKYLKKFAHVGIISGVTPSGIYTWESNTPAKGQRFYSWSNNSFSPLGGVVFVNAIGDTCQE